MPERRREQLALVLAGFVLCLAVRLPTLGALALWYDEIKTAHAVNLDWVDLAIERISTRHSPLYFWLLKALTPERSSEFVLRLPSAILDSLACAVFVFIAWRSAGRIGAVVMMILYAFGPHQIAYGQEARPYALLILFVALALLGYVLAISSTEKTEGRPGPPRERHGSLIRPAFVLATIGTIGAGLTMISGWIAAVIFQASIVVQTRAVRRRMIQPWRVHVALTWAAITPFAIAVFAPLEDAADGYWAEVHYPLSLIRLRELLDELLLHPGPDIGGVPEILQVAANSVWLILALVGLVAGRTRPDVRLFGFFGIAFPLLLIAVSVVQSVLVERYFLLALPFFSLLASVGASELWSRRWASPVVALLCLAVVYQGVHTTEVREKGDYRAVARFLNRNASQDVAMINSRGHVQLELGYYLNPKTKFSFERRGPEEVTAADLDRLVSEHRRLWLLYEEGAMPVLFGSIPARMIRCTWRHEETSLWRLVVLARERADLPRRLRSCQPENGGVEALAKPGR